MTIKLILVDPHPDMIIAWHAYMALAYKNFLQPPTNMSWQYAKKRQRSIRFGGSDGFSIKMD